MIQIKALKTQKNKKNESFDITQRLHKTTAESPTLIGPKTFQVHLLGLYLTRVFQMARTDEQCQMHTVRRNHELNYTQNWTTQSSVTCPIIIEKHW